MNINQSPYFKRSYRKLSADIQDDFDAKITIFVGNPRSISLRVHKLKGKWGECFAFRLKNGNRVFFEFVSGDKINLLDIGQHDIYKRKRK